MQELIPPHKRTVELTFKIFTKKQVWKKGVKVYNSYDKLGDRYDSSKEEETQYEMYNTVDAVGHVLCHDITRIVKDVTKDTAFRKGHIVTEEDIPVLLSLGKDHLYVWEKDESMLHENEAAQILCEICENANMHPTEVKEGKIELIADCDGLFRVDVARSGCDQRDR